MHAPGKKDLKSYICPYVYGEINQVENIFFRLPVAGAEKEAGRGKD